MSLLGLLGSRDQFPNRNEVDKIVKRYNQAMKVQLAYKMRRRTDPEAERTPDEITFLDDEGELDGDIVSDVKTLESDFRRARPDYVLFSEAVLRENDIIAKSFLKEHASICGTDDKKLVKVLSDYAQMFGDKCLAHFTPFGRTDAEREQHIASFLGRLYYAFHSLRWVIVEDQQYLMDWPLFSAATFSGIVNECTMYSRGWRRVSEQSLLCILYVACRITYA